MKQVNGDTIHIEKEDTDTYGRYNYGNHKIYINFKILYGLSKVINISFEKLICLVINHEYMHKLLYFNNGKDTCKKWDNIDEDMIQ
jgi:hypothetical protein